MEKFLIPKKDLLVRDPFSFTPLPASGGLVNWNGKSGRFWRRRVRCGDCIVDTQEDIVDTQEEPKEAIAHEPIQPKRKRSSK